MSTACNQLKSFIHKYRTPLQTALALVFIVVIFFALKDELRQVDMQDLHRMVNRLDLIDWIILVGGGLLAFSSCALYDLLFAHYLGLPL